MKETLKLLIDGMHCESCVRRVTDALQRVGGLHLKSVEVGSAQVAFNPQEKTADDIVAVINSIGFHAHLSQ